MNIEEIREYCIAKEDTSEGLPFGDDVLVSKVFGKIFAFLNLEGPPRLSLKCDPELAIELRERYKAVNPGYHLNKKHWNTISLDGSILDKEIFLWIDHSYNIVKQKR